MGIDERLPRVTEVLREAGLINTEFMTEHGRDRGIALHLACQYLDEGTLDYASIIPEIEGYLRAYDAWIRDSGIESFEWIECPLQDPQGRYRGTPDRILTVRPRKLVDIKSGAHHASHKWQTAAYVNMLEDPYSYRRLGVYLRSDGTYSTREFPKSEYAQDLGVFFAALTICNAKRLNNLK